MKFFHKKYLRFIFFIISDLFLFSGFVGVCMAFSDKKDKIGAMIFDQLAPIISFVIKLLRLIGVNISFGNFDMQYLIVFGILFWMGIAGNYFFLIKKR